MWICGHGVDVIDAIEFGLLNDADSFPNPYQIVTSKRLCYANLLNTRVLERAYRNDQITSGLQTVTGQTGRTNQSDLEP